MLIGETEPVPLCPKCDGSMRLERIIPRFGTSPEQRTYICHVCNETLTFSEDAKD
jgi:hypothetical protein